MTDSVLVVNAGSSSLKVKLLPQDLTFLVERIGLVATIKSNLVASYEKSVSNHQEALGICLQHLAENIDLQTVRVVGHRVVHGGEVYTRPTLLNEESIQVIEGLSHLAPLHNPANLEGIRAAQRLLPQAQHIAVFDTAFHASLPAKAYLYGLPRDLYKQGIRKYGFHGTSHDYVTGKAADILGLVREGLKIISLHLGNGASAAAVLHGKCVDTSMGLTPLDGLLMGTRTGEIDPGVLLHLLNNGLNSAELEKLLNKQSGLLGLSGLSNDMRDLRRAARDGHKEAREALEVFTYRITKTIGAYAAAMGGLDVVVFTGGIGENDSDTRRESLEGLEFLGIKLDQEKNARGDTEIQNVKSSVKILVVRTDEEGMIARAAQAVTQL
jgi:acetate kinase